MLKNRELSIQLKKTSPEGAQSEASEETDTIEQAKDAVLQVIFVSALAVYGFVALDTMRQVKIAKVLTRRNYTLYSEKG